MFSRFVQSLCAAVLCTAAIYGAAARVASAASPEYPSEETAVPVTLETFKAYALAHSPLAREIDARAAERLSEALTVVLARNPELDAEFRYPLSQEEIQDTEVTVSISQPMRLTSAALREQTRNLIAQAASDRQKLELLELSQEVTRCYTSLWSLSQKLASFRAARERLADSNRQIREATRKGLLSGGEERLLEAQIAEIKAASLEIEAQIAMARAELTRISALKIPPEKLVNPLFPPLPLHSELLQRALDNPLSITKRTALFERTAEKQLALARQNARGIIAPRIVFDHADSGSDRLGVGISVPLPFFNRNQPEIQQREVALQQQKAASQYLTNGAFEDELSALYLAVTTTERQLQIYRNEVIPNLLKSLYLQNQQLERGQGSVTQVWQIQQQLLSAESSAIDVWQSSIRARLQLWSLVGEEV